MFAGLKCLIERQLEELPVDFPTAGLTVEQLRYPRRR
jgi:hypothetical protein